MKWSGIYLVAVSPRTQARHARPYCGHIARENQRTQAQFQCVDCGYENHADVVGAINILERGHRAC
ncbi:zinc ribbon domain-containing protein [Thorsellia anophelis]|uniref:zinc ribbon domain-containing protein n=1 Tax=Thorsellia anophelis TaxID=336804 RepID=UPI003CCBACD4